MMFVLFCSFARLLACCCGCRCCCCCHCLLRVFLTVVCLMYVYADDDVFMYMCCFVYEFNLCLLGYCAVNLFVMGLVVGFTDLSAFFLTTTTTTILLLLILLLLLLLTTNY